MLKKSLLNEIIVFTAIFFIVICFCESMYLNFFGLDFRMLKIIYILLYSIIFASLSVLPKENKNKYFVMSLFITIVTLLYFGEASYFNLFKSFAL